MTQAAVPVVVDAGAAPPVSAHEAPLVLEHPHTRGSKTIMQYDHAAAGRLNCVGHPVTFVGEERSAGLPPPMLGQHTDEVLKEMGLSPETIEGLRREDVVS